MILDVEPGVGRSYFFKLLNLTAEQYFKLTVKLELLQTLFTLVHLSYFIICEHQVSLIDDSIIIVFESAYLLLCNCLPFMCLKFCQHLYSKISNSHEKWNASSQQQVNLGQNYNEKER